MGIQKYKRPLLVTGVPVPQSGGGTPGEGSVTADPDTLALRGSDGSLRAVAGEEDDSVVNELRLNEVQNGITEYINGLTEPATTENYGTVRRGAYVQELDESAEIADVIEKVNELIVALRTSGAMEPLG